MKKRYHAATEIGLLTSKLAQGYFAYSAAMIISTDARAIELAPKIEPGQIVPVGRVKHINGGEHTYDFLYYLNWAKTEKVITDELARIWFSGTLLRIGDLLAQNNYFDRAPELELIRHLRNGIAHGNRFRIDNPDKLKKFPAFYRTSSTDPNTIKFKIGEHLIGQEVLFDFITPADLVTMLQSLGNYLTKIGDEEGA